MQTRMQDATLWQQRPLTQAKLHFLRVNAQMYNLDKQKTDV